MPYQSLMFSGPADREAANGCFESTTIMLFHTTCPKRTFAGLNERGTDHTLM